MSRLAELRANAADDVMRHANRVHELRTELADTERRQRDAETELVYWTNVREPDEVLRLCLQKLEASDLIFDGDSYGARDSNIAVQRVVRDGITLYICMAEQPCPVHGRPLGGSDWRLHPMSDEFRTGLVASGRMTERDETLDSNARSIVHREGGVERGGIVYPTPGDLPTGKHVECPIHHRVCAPDEICPDCVAAGEKVAAAHPFPTPTPDL